jgi:hypothetical protein
VTFKLTKSSSKMQINLNLTVLGRGETALEPNISCDLLLGIRLNLQLNSFLCSISWGLPENLKVFCIGQNSWKAVSVCKLLLK